MHDVVNFEEKTFCEEIQQEAWGYVDYMRELAQCEVEDYELTPAGLKTFWCVTTSFDDKGHVVSAITDKKKAVNYSVIELPSMKKL